MEHQKEEGSLFERMIGKDELTLIVSFCAIKDLCKVSLVNKRWMKVLKDEVLWNLLLNLHFPSFPKHLKEQRTLKTLFEVEWKKALEGFKEGPSYSLSNNNRKVTAQGTDGWNKVVLGKASISEGKKTWTLKINKIANSAILIGVAPSNIDQSMIDPSEKCGYYFYTADGLLWSGPPFNYTGKEYEEWGTVNKWGNTVGIELDWEEGTLSFSHEGKKLGVAYSGIPKDQPLNLCILFWDVEDEVELLVD